MTNRLHDALGLGNALSLAGLTGVHDTATRVREAALGINALKTNSLANLAGAYDTATRAREAALGINALKTNSLANLAGAYDTATRAREAALGINALKTNSLANLAGAYDTATRARDAALGITNLTKPTALADLAGTYRSSIQAREAALGITALDRGLARERDEWERLSREARRLVPPSLPKPILVDVPDLVDGLAEALEVQAERDRAATAEHTAALTEVVGAGKAQNVLMSEIVGLQKLLVQEALENSRIQRVVLYFTALSGALAIIALLLK